MPSRRWRSLPFSLLLLAAGCSSQPRETADASADATRTDGGGLPDGETDGPSKDGGHAHDSGPGDATEASIGPEWDLPADTNVIDVVAAYGADPTGVNDSTALIQQAISDHISLAGSNAPDVVLYFRNGTYKLTDRLEWRKLTSNGCSAGGYNWGAYLSFWGQNRDKTILKLEDDAPGFQDASTPRAVVYTASIGGCSDDTSFFDWTGLGEGNQAFSNNINDLTIDIGNGNPGAIGLDYMANNTTRINDVTITGHAGANGSGAIGVAMNRNEVGPLLITNLEVDYFGTGISAGKGDTSLGAAGVVLENVTLGHVGEGIVNSRGSFTSGRLVTVLTNSTSSPAVVNQGDGVVTLLDSSLSASLATSGTTYAISNDATDTASLYLRGINASGGSLYTNLVAGTASATLGGEWVSTPPLRLAGTATHSLDLPIEDTPDTTDTDVSHWVNVESYGAKPDDTTDDAAGIEMAIANAVLSGKTVVYFPQGSYVLGSTITIAASIHLLGFGAAFEPASGFGGPAFEISSGVPTGAVVTLERLRFVGTSWSVPIVEDSHPSGSSVVLKDLVGLRFSYGVGGTSHVGDLYLEDVGSGPFQFGDGQSVWARHLDPEEDPSYTHVVNDGATVWILGLKTEERDPACVPAIDTEEGGTTELLGGAIMNWRLGWCGTSSAGPVFLCNACRESLVYATAGNATNSVILSQVEETAGGTTETLFSSGRGTPAADVKGLDGTVDMSRCPLFVGY